MSKENAAGVHVQDRLTVAEREAIIYTLRALETALASQQKALAKLHSNPKSGSLGEMIRGACDDCRVADAAVIRVTAALLEPHER